MHTRVKRQTFLLAKRPRRLYQTFDLFSYLDVEYETIIHDMEYRKIVLNPTRFASKRVMRFSISYAEMCIPCL